MPPPSSQIKGSESKKSPASSSEEDGGEPVKKNAKKHCSLPKGKAEQSLTSLTGLVDPDVIKKWTESSEMRKLSEKKQVLTNLADWIGRLETNIDCFVGQCMACPVHCLGAMRANVKAVPGRKRTSAPPVKQSKAD